MTNYDLDEIKRLWKKEPDEWVLKAVTTNASSYPPEVLDIIIEEAASRDLIQFEDDDSAGLETNAENKISDETAIKSVNLSFFKDNSFRTRCVQAFLILSVILWSFAVYSGFLEYNLLNDIEQGVFVSEEEIANAYDINDIRQGLIGLGQLFLGTVTFVFFMLWIYRSNKNAKALTVETMKFTSGWAVGWFFIPIAFVWKPYQVVKEIWRVSSREFTESDSAGHSIVGYWWALWLLSGALGQATFKLHMRAEEIDEFIQANSAYMISDAADIVLKVVTFLLVHKIFSMQKQCFERKSQTLETMKHQLRTFEI